MQHQFKMCHLRFVQRFVKNVIKNLWFKLFLTSKVLVSVWPPDLPTTVCVSIFVKSVCDMKPDINMELIGHWGQRLAPCVKMILQFLVFSPERFLNTALLVFPQSLCFCSSTVGRLPSTSCLHFLLPPRAALIRFSVKHDHTSVP